RNYLHAHLYANATAEDFWSAQTAASHKPVDKIMQSFVEEPGVPLLTLTQAQGGQVGAGEVRFSLTTPTPCDRNKSCAPKPSDAAWTIPVCFKTAAAPLCDVLTPGGRELAVPASAPF